MAKISAGSGFHCGFGYLRDVFELVLLGAWAVAGDGLIVTAVFIVFLVAGDALREGLFQIDYSILVWAHFVNVGLMRGWGVVYVVNKS